MDLFVLDGHLRKVDLVDRYESLIWTDRWNAIGDFSLDIHSNTRHRRWLTPGRLLHTPESHHVMVIETVTDTVTSSGEYMMKAEGRSIEKILHERIAARVGATWELTDTPGNLMRKLVDDICRLGTHHWKDVLPYLNNGGTFYPEADIPEPGEQLTLEFEPETLYALIESLALSYDLGFEFRRNPKSEDLRFAVWTGVDRTTAVSDNQPIVFSIDMGTMDGSTLLHSIANYRNVAMVVSAQGRLLVTSGNDDAENLGGFNRRYILVNSSEITVDWPSARARARMLLEGKAALAASRRITAFDGELSKFDSYRYMTDYYLGDLVELRTGSGEISYMRVVEQILSCDPTGVHSYPTLELLETITPGSWLSQDGNATWADQTTATWATPETTVMEV